METKLLILITFIFIVSTCNNGKNNVTQQRNAETKNTIPGITDNTGLIPVFGYRFIIQGDFDGDGKTEHLVEHYISRIDNKETHKFYKNQDDYDKLVEMTINKEPLSFVISDNPVIDTLFISEGFQHFGLAFLRNEGDLDGDGGDEVSYVTDYADWSSVNTCHIMSYKNGKWTELYSFEIRDWLLPVLPGAVNDYGSFGLSDKIIISDDSLNTVFEKNLLDFEGFIKRISKNKIQVVYINEEVEIDTIQIDLSKIK